MEEILLFPNQTEQLSYQKRGNNSFVFLFLPAYEVPTAVIGIGLVL